MTSEIATAAYPGRQQMRHAPFAAALLAGIAIRIVVGVAYRPAIIFYDTTSYLNVAAHPYVGTFRPIGYSLILWPFLQVDPASLLPISVFQHVLGLLVAVACYAFLLRRGLPAWVATLAALPVLLDPLQLVLEHYVLSDVAFEAMLVAACLMLLWKNRPGIVLLAGSGLAVGSCALVRGAGSFLLVVFLVAAVCLRVGWVRVVTFGVAALLPIAAYATAYHAKYGEYALSPSGSRFLYARVAPIVRCQDPQLKLPRYEKMLCPHRPVGSRPSSDYFMWGHHQGPAYHVVPPPGMTVEQVLGDFAKRVVRAQPRAYTQAALADFARGFYPSRTYDVPGFPSRYWLFKDHYWMLKTRDWHPTDAPAAAGFLQTYRQVLWTPGPLNAVLLLVAAVAALGLGRARRSGDRVAIGLLAGSGAVTLLTTAAVSGFSWRYQLPQLALFPVAGALGAAALLRGRATGQPEPSPPVRLLDRAAESVARWHPGLRRLDDRGRLALPLAAVAGLVVAVMAALVAVRSGWFRPELSLLVGAGAGVAVGLMLVVAHLRTAADLPADRPDRHVAGTPRA